jgi:ferredoxin
MSVDISTLGPLVTRLRADGYVVIGPVRSGDAIVLAELTDADQLPYGWGVETGPGHYRVRPRDDRAAFGHAAGPQAWKRYLHPPRELVASAHRVGPSAEDVTFDGPDEPTVRYAFLGVRPCDLRAIAVQDRVLGASRSYAARREAALIIAVNCTEPSATCFCVSAGGGPRAESGYDIALTELVDGSIRYVATAGSDRGAEVLAGLPSTPASEADLEAQRAAVDAAADRMGRALPDVAMAPMLAATLEAPRWEDVAQRCLACGNCTMACPTCFCTSVTDTTDLTGEHAQRWQQWASCFELDFSYLHGGPVRPSIRSRYRQWLTHKLGTWHDQFGESGCVGCGRCIAWCPVGIDITEEAAALSTWNTTAHSEEEVTR